LVHRLALVLSTGLLTLAVGACGGVDEATPVACLEGGAFYLAPRDAEPPVSECLTENQAGGDLATVGGAMVGAATRLNAEAREGPGGPAAIRLGYLVGAAERGAGETEGIHADLLRRLRAAALYSPAGRGLPATVLSAYRRGLAAGRVDG
jgi:hypothetical protein